MSKPPTLYYAPDNASLCVRLALLELDLPIDTKLVDRTTQGQRDLSYLALNPNGIIPTLVTDDGPIYETAAILLWLSDHAKGGFLPPDMSRGAALSWMFWLSNTLHVALRMWFYPDKYISPDAVLALNDATRSRLADLFGHLEVHAAWLDSPAPSVFSCYLGPMARWAGLYGPDQEWFDLSQYPRLTRYLQAAETRASAHQASRAEGLGGTIFTNPSKPNPPEGSAI